MMTFWPGIFYKRDHVCKETSWLNKKTRSLECFQYHSIPSGGCVPEVGLGQLVGHWQDGQRTVLLRPKRLIDTTAVDQTPLPALNEHFAQQLLVILAVQLEGLREKGGQNQMCVLYLRVSNGKRTREWKGGCF